MPLPTGSRHRFSRGKNHLISIYLYHNYGLKSTSITVYTSHLSLDMYPVSPVLNPKKREASGRISFPFFRQISPGISYTQCILQAALQERGCLYFRPSVSDVSSRETARSNRLRVSSLPMISIISVAPPGVIRLPDTAVRRGHMTRPTLYPFSLP